MSNDGYDPFADDEPVQGEESPVEVEPTQSAEWTVTMKAGSGFDSPWTVGRGTVDQLAADLRVDADLKSIMEMSVKTGKWYSRLFGGNTSGGGKSESQRPAQQEAPGGEKKYCKHGEMRFNSGVNKQGKPYKGFFCTAEDRDEQCKPEWVS